ncbi:MAG: glutathione S-transferase family protein [Gammaproteobacteria bacterium]
MIQHQLILVSHTLCPYVQRAAIVLAEKSAPFERRNVDLANKPDWFLAVSPLGRTPVLLVNGQPVFESAVICEYLEETLLPRLHPVDPLHRAHHRSWVEFSSALLGSIYGLYTAADREALQIRINEIRARLKRVESALGNGPYFAGEGFSIVDAAFAPVFRYFDVFDTIEDFGVFDTLAKVKAWRAALHVRPSVRGAVGANYAEELGEFLVRRGSEMSRLVLQAVE